MVSGSFGSSGYTYSRDELSSLAGFLRLGSEKSVGKNGRIGWGLIPQWYPICAYAMLKIAETPENAFWIGGLWHMSPFLIFGVWSEQPRMYFEAKFVYTYPSHPAEGIGDGITFMAGLNIYYTKRQFFSLGAGAIGSHYLLQLGGGFLLPSS